MPSLHKPSWGLFVALYALFGLSSIATATQFLYPDPLVNTYTFRTADIAVVSWIAKADTPTIFYNCSDTAAIGAKITSSTVVFRDLPSPQRYTITLPTNTAQGSATYCVFGLIDGTTVSGTFLVLDQLAGGAPTTWALNNDEVQASLPSSADANQSPTSSGVSSATPSPTSVASASSSAPATSASASSSHYRVLTKTIEPTNSATSKPSSSSTHSASSATSSVSGSQSTSGLSFTATVGIGIGAGAVGLILIGLGLCLCLRKRQRHVERSEGVRRSQISRPKESRNTWRRTEMENRGMDGRGSVNLWKLPKWNRISELSVATTFHEMEMDDGGIKGRAL